MSKSICLTKLFMFCNIFGTPLLHDVRFQALLSVALRFVARKRPWREVRLHASYLSSFLDGRVRERNWKRSHRLLQSAWPNARGVLDSICCAAAIAPRAGFATQTVCQT